MIFIIHSGVVNTIGALRLFPASLAFLSPRPCVAIYTITIIPTGIDNNRITPLNINPAIAKPDVDKALRSRPFWSISGSLASMTAETEVTVFMKICTIDDGISDLLRTYTVPSTSPHIKPLTA